MTKDIEEKQLDFLNDLCSFVIDNLTDIKDYSNNVGTIFLFKCDTYTDENGGFLYSHYADDSILVRSGPATAHFHKLDKSIKDKIETSIAIYKL